MFSLWNIITTTAPDFSVYFEGAVRLVSHLPLYGNTGLYTGIGYPPESLLIYVPFTILPYLWAQNVWTVLSLVSLFVSVYLSLQVLRVKSTFLTLLLIIFAALLSFPVKFTLGMGQSNLIALSMLVLSMYFLGLGKKTLAGVILGVATVMKPHLGVFLIGAILSGHLMMALISVFIHGIAIGITGILFGWQNFYQYLTGEIPYMMKYRGEEIYYNQGVRAIISRLFSDAYAPWVIFGVNTFVIATVCWIIWQRKLSFVTSCLLLIPVLLLIEPMSWQHHYVFLIPPCIYLFHRLISRLQRGLFILAVILVCVNLNLAGQPLHTWYAKLVASHVGIGSGIIYVLLLLNV